MSAAVAASAVALCALALAGWTVAAMRRRAELMARALHEVAGPLQAAGLGLRLAGLEGPAPRLAAIDLELQRAARALDDLDAARRGRTAGPAPAPLAVVDAGCLVAQQALTWQASARERGRTLRVAAGTGLLVRADGVRLAQAVGNLLANALEHGAGRVTLRARSVGCCVRIEVSDDGPGVPMAALDRRPRGGRGARGRGLAIARDVIRGCGGTLFVLESGAIALELPAATGDGATSAARLTAPPRAGDTP